MKMFKKNPEQKLFAIVSVCAVLSLLFAACPGPADPGGNNGGGVSKTALTTAITEAETFLNGVKTSADGSGLADGDKFATMAEKTAFQTAINAAKAVKDKADATQSEVYAAVTALAAARATFEGFMGTVGTLNLTLLNSTITAAEALLDSVTAGNGSGLADGAKYAAQDDIDDFQDAVDEAKGVQADTTATQAQVNAAVTALLAARTVFDGKVGTVGGSAPKGDLNAAIQMAQDFLDAVVISADGSDVAAGGWWVTSEDEKTAFQAAIDAAQAVSDNPTASLAQVSAAIAALEAAVETFITDVATMVPVDKTELGTAITAAETITNITIADDDYSLLKGTFYAASEDDKEEFEEALAAAKAVFDDPDVMQADINEARAALNAARGKIKTAQGRLALQVYESGSEVDPVYFNYIDRARVKFEYDSDWKDDVYHMRETYNTQAPPNGYGDYNATQASVPFDNSKSTLTGMTFAFWFKPDFLEADAVLGNSESGNNAAVQYIFRMGNYGMETSNTTGLGVVSDAGPTFLSYIDSSKKLCLANGAIEICSFDPATYTGEWTHLALTWESEMLILYINGVKQGDWTDKEILAWAGTIWETTYYNDPGHADNSFEAIALGGVYCSQSVPAWYADLRLYDTVLNATEILAIVNERP
jgi:hypothetical protein